MTDLELIKWIRDKTMRGKTYSIDDLERNALLIANRFDYYLKESDQS